MKQGAAALLLILLGACTGGDTTSPSPVTFRDTTAQIASQTDVTADRMTGRWFVRQVYTGQPGRPRELQFAAQPGGALLMSVPEVICPGAFCTREMVQLRLDPSGPGRWRATAAQPFLPGGEVWVLWMDFDSRTMALGTPAGTYGMILDQGRDGGGDRIAAAREIMEWFGYDMERLRSVQPLPEPAADDTMVIDG